MKSFALFLVLFTFGCATDRPEGKTQAEVLFKEAQELMDDGRYILATEKLNQLKNQFPYSFYATPSELLQADILFEQENYVEAAAAYLLFKDFHPKHERMPYVVYMTAESYFKQIPDTYDRDLQAAFEAIKYYNELTFRYPETKYAKKAQSKIEKAERMIRDKEQYIADFYYKTEVYEAARWRYLHILDNFSDKDLTRHSMERVILSSYMMKDYEKCDFFSNKYSSFLGEQSSKLEETIDSCKRKLKQ